MKIIYLVIIVFLAPLNVGATNYYLSNNGHDANSGNTKEKPWRTLKKLNEYYSAQLHDSIFFERGSIFKGQLILSHASVYLGAYGSGAKPIISGSLVVDNWILFKENIWRAECHECSSQPNNLFIDGKYQTLGRYPNNGYLSLSAYNPVKLSAEDNKLNFLDNYWTNAELVVRSSRWTIDRLTVTDYKNNSFYTQEKPSYLLQPGFGYFIQNHLSTLDQHGEWYFDSKTKQLYIFLKKNFIANQHLIEVNNSDIGLNGKDLNNLTIENIVFDKQNNAGVRITNCNNAQLYNIEIKNSGKNGIDIISCKRPTIKKSLIKNSNNNGIECQDSPGATVSNNRIASTGVHPGRGASGNGTHIAIYLTPSEKMDEQSSIDYNTIDSTGYSGIDFRTGNTSIKNNYVSHFCLVKDDGAGIYTWGNSKKENSIEGNTVYNGVGNGAGTINDDELYVSGIYIDDRSSYILVKNNSVSNCSMAGIFIHNSTDIRLIKNILFANGNCIPNKEKGQLYIKLDSIGGLKHSTNFAIQVTQNQFTATKENSSCLFLSVLQKEDLNNIGSFELNQFTAYHPDQAVALFYHQSGICSTPEKLSLSEWHNASFNHSRSSFKTLSSKGNFSTHGEELVYGINDNLQSQGWISWPEKSTIENENISPVNAIKINIPAEIKEALLYHSGIYLNSKKIYRLSFMAKSSEPSKIEFVPLMASSPWSAIGKYACFSVGEVYKKFTYYFTCDTNDVEARVNFKSNTTFWVKDVTLYEVNENSAVAAK